MLGIDISSYQSIESVDLAPDFVIIKATQGTAYVNPLCDAQYQRALSQGKLLGVYHYASGGDPIAEANFFVDNCEGYIGKAILALDWEEYQNPRFYEYASWCKIFLDHVYARTGVRPLIYMSASVISAANWSSISKDYGLWVAGYPDLRDSWDIPEFIYNIPYWEFVAIWQYTNSNGYLDRDVAYMDKDAWKKYAARKTEEIKIEKQPEIAEETITPKVAETPAQNKLNPVEYLAFIDKTKQSVELVEKEINKYGIKINLPNKVYDVLKVLVSIVLPMISALYIGLANIWGFGFGEEVDKTIQLIIVTINALLGITIVKSSKDYKD